MFKMNRIIIFQVIFSPFLFNVCKNEPLKSIDYVPTSVLYTTESEPVTTWCRTQIPHHKVNFIWTIDNFDYYEAAESSLKSPEFSARTNEKFKWFLELNPNRGDGAMKNISLYLYLDAKSERKRAYAQFNFSILNNQLEERYTSASSELHFFQNKSSANSSSSIGWGYAEFVQKDDYFRKNLLSNNKLTIQCKLSFYAINNIASNKSDTFHQCNTSIIQTVYLETSVSENFKILARKYEFKPTDLTLRVNNNNYTAHKDILSARSPIFAAIIQNKTKNSDQDFIDIKDTDEEIVSEMLRYMYTGKCENLDKLADGLLGAADKYDLNGLKVIASNALLKTLSVDNAADILISADMYHANQLKSHVVTFIVRNSAEVFNTTAWINLELSNPRLLVDVCRALSHKLTTFLN